jgi:hypothetical protein
LGLGRRYVFDVGRHLDRSASLHRERTLNGIERPVFNEILVLRASTFGTYRAEVEAPTPGDVTRLIEAGECDAIVIEDWSQSLEMLCRACSEGARHDRHEHRPAEAAWRTTRLVGIASEDDLAPRRVLNEWTSASVGRGVHCLERAL